MLKVDGGYMCVCGRERVLKVDGALVFWHTFRAMVGKEDTASGGLPALSP